MSRTTAGRGDDAGPPDGMGAGEGPHFPGYTLLARVARGSRRDVWRATRVDDDMPVAIKVFAAGDTTIAAREAEIAAAVAHPHIVSPLETAIAAGGEVGVVLPWFADGSLADLIGIRRRLRWRETLTVLIPLADALASAHERDFVHGDLSPANVLFDPAGKPMLADFGAARAATESGFDVAVTPAHAAPELVRGATPSPSSDLFSLGSLALMCLTGRPAWCADDVQDVLIQSTAGQWPALEDYMAPPALQRLVHRLLSPEPPGRTTSAALAVDLRRVGSAEPIDIVARSANGDAPTTHAATVVRADAVRPPADDWPRVESSRWQRARVAAATRLTAIVAARSRLSWRAVGVMTAVAVLAWAGTALGWGPATGPSHPSAATDRAGGDRAPTLDDPVASGPRVLAAASAGRTPAGDGAAPSATRSANAADDAVSGTGGTDATGGTGGTDATGGTGGTDATGGTGGTGASGTAGAGIVPSADVTAQASDADWLAVMKRLDRVRSRAFVARDAGLLAGVYAPGAAGMVEDTARIAELRVRKMRVDDAQHHLESVDIIDLDAGGGVILAVRERQDAVAVLDETGAVVASIAAVPESVHFVHLVAGEGGFRISRVEVH